MFILDDILLSPLKGFLMIAKEIQEAAHGSLAGEAQQITQRLQSLYQQLEAGEITEAEFDEQEDELLDRLEEIEQMLDGAEDADDDEEDDDDDGIKRHAPGR
ncbi:MAG: gas vesicle protein GvpG [Planctomycetota bacterium]